MNPETLRTIATIIALPHRDPASGAMRQASVECVMLAQCGRYVADAIERDDPNLPPGWRKPKPAPVQFVPASFEMAEGSAACGVPGEH